MDRERKPTPDEQVYEDNKDEPRVNVVYSSETGNEGVSDVDVDEASAESFPASDTPASSSSAAVPRPDAGGKDG
jgi:hypothetical protein